MNSMTGYGSATVAFDGREITLELKSVNHRFLDINIRMPRVLMFAEEELRKAIGNYIARGHVEVNLTYRNTREDSKIITVDKALVLQYANAFNEIAEFGFENNMRVCDVARMPDVLTITQCDDDNEAVLKLILEALDKAAQSLNNTRKIEGDKIGEDLKNKLHNIYKISKDIEKLSENNLSEYALRLQKRLDDLLGDNKLDEQRLHQEIAIYADKIAIDEELVRLETHINNMLDYMSGTGEMGRKLDFFIQELNREINTIGSKSVNADIAKLVVTAKGEIEKLREQIQNIE
ncbi:MAG: YicC family protein [Clostridiales bacterium]|nr:YicC family protein [Clostridiales bacterium]